ncbi:MAG TPA: TatD family hydrolase [Bryobacteraceae bacterium]|jgi:TatD DNase family protein|nr:TatD family hydrolase [Bryobacteraceae bacterium]
MAAGLIDSHCHLDDEQFDSDRDEALQRALDAGLERLVVIGTGDGPPDLEAGVRLADRHGPIWATVGIHPQHASKATDNLFPRISELLKHPKVVALGEIGLDYHWEPFSKDDQHRVFLTQMEIAKEAGKPIVIHTRDAWEDTLELLETHWAAAGLPSVLHCFTGGPDIAAKALKMGCLLSFAGVVTYPKATDVQASAAAAPLDRILVETDAPYLPPVPFRGKRNEPAYVTHTAKFLAKLRQEEFEDFVRATSSNWTKTFLSYTK